MTIRQVAVQGLSRYPNAVAQPFREAAAELFGITPDMILCGNGSDDLLTILTRTFVGSGELLRLPYPSYILYKSLAEIQGAESEEVRFNADWSLPDYFGQKPVAETACHLRPVKTDRLKLVYLPNPNSPSGTLIPPERIAQIAQSLPCPLVVDEAYADFAGTHCVSLLETIPNLIITRTMSKSYALAGLRFGFLMARPELVEQLVKVKDSYNCDAIAIAAATAAIKDQDWLCENKAKILATRTRLRDRMRELGFLVPDSFANFTWNVYRDESVSPRQLYLHLKEHGYLVRYMSYAGWGDGLRISVGTDEQIDNCLNLIERFLGR